MAAPLVCREHGQPFRLDAWGDARHEDGAHCWTGPRLAWRSVDGAGSEQHPELTRDEAERMAVTLNAELGRDGRNPWGYRYSVRGQ